jgi:hypothetical protein
MAVADTGEVDHVCDYLDHVLGELDLVLSLRDRLSAKGTDDRKVRKLREEMASSVEYLGLDSLQRRVLVRERYLSTYKVLRAMEEFFVSMDKGEEVTWSPSLSDESVNRLRLGFILDSRRRGGEGAVLFRQL